MERPSSISVSASAIHSESATIVNCIIRGCEGGYGSVAMRGGTITNCVFYNNTRALFGESLNNCSPDDFKNQMKDLVVVQRNGKYVIERKDSVSNDLSNKD